MDGNLKLILAHSVNPLEQFQLEEAIKFSALDGDSCRKAAEQGNADCYDRGEGVEKDPKAIKIFDF